MKQVLWALESGSAFWTRVQTLRLHNWNWNSRNMKKTTLLAMDRRHINIWQIREDSVDAVFEGKWKIPRQFRLTGSATARDQPRRTFQTFQSLSFWRNKSVTYLHGNSLSAWQTHRILTSPEIERPVLINSVINQILPISYKISVETCVWLAYLLLFNCSSGTCS